MSSIWRDLSVRRLCVRCLNTMEDLRQQKYLKSRKIAHICLERATREQIINYLRHYDRYATREYQSSTSRLWKGALRQLSLSQWLSFIKSLHVLQEDAISIAFSIFWIKLLQKLYSAIERLSKNYHFAYLRSDAIRRHAGRAEHERTAVCTAQTSVLRIMSFVFAAVERYLSFTALSINVLHRGSSF